jgi:hypothetical protein
LLLNHSNGPPAKVLTVIKEVNHFLIDWFIQDYSPRIIYLLRHPLPWQAASIKGWSGEQFRSRLSDKTLHDFSISIDCLKPSGRTGLLQAIVLQLIEILQDYPICGCSI